MSYNGSGTFVINTAGQPVVSGTVISSTAFNALTADLATGLSTAITKDGQTTPTANIPMGNNKITNLAVGTAATDAANLSQVQSTTAKLVNSISGADTITGTMSPTLGAYATGQMFYFIAAGDNTGAVTLNIDSLGAKSVTRDGTTALAAGDIQSGEVCVVVYDGTRFQLVNGASQSASIVTENLTVNKATVLNESGGDNDTRIEGDTDANLVFVDASTDRVGVGTSTPQAKFVASNGGANGYELDPVNGFISAYNRSTNAWTKITTRASSYTFNLNNSNDALNLDSSGNLGLGVTPPAASTPSMFSDASVFGGSSESNISNNATFNSGWKYINTAGATRYQQVASEHRWFYAASGTAGNAITFTQAMTLDASGILSLGVSGARLSFTGTSGDKRIGQGDALVTGGGSTDFAMQATNAILFATGGTTERARITSGGDFLVGATSYATSATGFLVNGSTVKGACISVLSGSTNSASTYEAYSTGASAYRFYVGMAGTVFATNTTISAISDQRLKENIRDLDIGLNAIMALKPRKFDWKQGKGKDIKNDRGFVAQEFEQVFPDLIDEWNDPAPEGEEPYKSVRQDLIPVLVKAMQEQQAMIKALETKVAALEAK